ncbi:MAG: GIY-YIG nuclease family protein [Flavobacteriaceae bacterium]|nr:GIY-YIG nuclease family protein [Flavobacteriaceae bacterium]
MVEQQYYVYILTTKNHKLFYTGYSRKLKQRIKQHKSGYVLFTKKYNCTKLVYFEVLNDKHTTLKREKLIKKYSREFKRNLINKMNPNWEDLFEQLDRF